MSQQRLRYQPLPTVEMVAQHLVTVCSEALTRVLYEQSGVLEELGQTEAQREQLMRELGSHFYAQEISSSFPRRLMQLIIDEHELQELCILWGRFVPNSQIVEQCYRFLTNHKDVPYASILPIADLSQVHAAERGSSRGTLGIRSRRDTRRTGRCDERSMPEDGLPPRV